MTEWEWLISDDPKAMLDYLLRRDQESGTIAGDKMGCRTSDRKLRLAAWFCAELKEPNNTALAETYRKWAAQDQPDPGQEILALWLLRLHDRDKPVVAHALRNIVGNPFRAVTLPPGPKPPTTLHPCPECRFPDRSCRLCRGTSLVWAACRVCLDTRQIYTGMDGMKWIPCTRCPQPGPCPWLTPTVLSLTQAIDDDHDFGLMPILHDALLDAGCDSEDMLNHCQGRTRCTDCLELSPADGCPYCGGSRWVEDWWRRTPSPSPPVRVRGDWVIDLLLGKS